MTPENRAWLAGLLEGEGSFHVSRHHGGQNIYAIIELSMVDRDVVERAAALMKGVAREQNPPSRRKNGWQPQWRVRLFGTKAVTLMQELQPLMGERRQIQIEKALSGGRRTRNADA